jgi:hypothetical protein
MPRSYITQQNADHVIMTLARGNNLRVNALNLTKLTCIHYCVQFMFLTDVCRRTHHLLKEKNAQHKRFTSDTFTTIRNQYQWCGTQRRNWSHHNFMSCLMITSTLSKHPIRISNKWARWTAYFKKKGYTYDDPFGNEHTYLFSHGGADIHPDNLIPTIETCQASFTMTPCSDTQQNNSTKINPNNKSILSMQDLMILHANNIYPQSNRDDFKAYKNLHGIYMQIHSIPKSPKQKAQEMELSDLHHEEFKIFALEYNASSTEPNNKLDHYVNTLQQHNKDFGPEINGMFLNNLDPTFYAMQMKNPDVLTHAQMKRQVDANKFIETQRPEIEGLMDINTFEFIPKINL